MQNYWEAPKVKASPRGIIMAKKTSRVIVVLSSPDGKQTYTTTKNRRNTEGKLVLRKYSPSERKVVEYKETKVKKGK